MSTPPVVIQEVPLPVELQLLLKNECWRQNPMSECVYDIKFKELIYKLHKYKKLMSACGHDTQELEGALARAEASIQELKHVNEWMHDQFTLNPFPFVKGAAEGSAEEAAQQEAEGSAEEAAQQEESNKDMNKGDKIEDEMKAYYATLSPTSAARRAAAIAAGRTLY